jgi:hypothetical protein
MAYCKKCGNALGDEQQFCPKCGEAVEGAIVPAAAAPAPPAPAAPGPVAPPAPYAPVAAPAQASGGSRKGLWIALAALVVAIAVACALVFGVFKDQIFDGGGAAAGAEKAVQTFLTAMENKDIDKLFEVMDPATYQEVLDLGLPLDSVKTMVAEELFTYDSMEFSDIKMQTTETGEGEATVAITRGMVTIVENGATESKSVLEADTPTEFILHQTDGKWQIEMDSM